MSKQGLKIILNSIPDAFAAHLLRERGLKWQRIARELGFSSSHAARMAAARYLKAVRGQLTALQMRNGKQATQAQIDDAKAKGVALAAQVIGSMKRKPKAPTPEPIQAPEPAQTSFDSLRIEALLNKYAATLDAYARDRERLMNVVIWFGYVAAISIGVAFGAWWW